MKPGSILGSLLFLLYIYIYIHIHIYVLLIIKGVKLVLFADDTNSLLVDKNKDALQQKNLYVMKELQTWLQKKSHYKY